MSIVHLKTSDGKVFTCDKGLCVSMIKSVKVMLECLDGDHSAEEIPLANVDSKQFERILEFLQHYHGLEEPEDPMMTDAEKKAARRRLTDWDLKYFQSMHMTDIYAFINAVNFTDIPLLLDRSIGYLASIVKGKKPAQIRETLGIANDWTPEEEALMKQEDQWVDER